MRLCFGTILYLFSIWGLTAQIGGRVLNKETKEPLPYVTVRKVGTNKGTTTNIDGTYKFDDVLNADTINFSSVGFQERSMLAHEIKDTIYLTQNITILSTVSVKPLKGKTKYHIGKIKKSKINSYQACGEKLYAIGRKIEYKEAYQNTPFIESIKLMTGSDIKEAKLLIDIREMKEDGQNVGNSLIPNALILTVEKRKKLTAIDISKHQIKFPKTGLFIGVTWLMISSNKYEYTVSFVNDKKKKQKRISYEPAVGMIKSKTNEDSFINLDGNWKNSQKLLINKKREALYPYLKMPVELVLSD